MTSQVYNLDGPKEFPFPYPVRAAAQLTVEIVPGNVVSPGDYEVVGVGPTSTQVTVRYPNAPTTGGLQLKISRYVAPERVTVIDDPSDITTVNLNAEFNNIYEALIDFEEFILNLVQQMLDDFQNDVLDPALAEINQARDDAIAAKDAAEAAQQGAEEAEQGATAAWDAFQDRYWGAYPTDPSISPIGNPPTAGDLYWNTTVNQWRAWDANQGAWVSVTSAVPTYYDRRNYIATEGQTTFDAQYDAGFVQVWVNGLLLPPSDYEASTGAEVVLDEGVAAGTEVSIVGLGAVAIGVLDGDNAVVTTLTGTQLLPDALNDRVAYVDDITALRALTGMQDGQAAQITTTGRAGLFRWDSSDLSAEVANDPQMGIYVPPTGQDGSAGAWVRVLSSPVLTPQMFGAAGDGVNSDGPSINAALSISGALGASVFLPAGDYATDETISVGNRRHFWGENTTWSPGAGSVSRIVWTGPAGGVVVQCATSPFGSEATVPRTGVKIHDIYIDGSDTASVGFYGAMVRDDSEVRQIVARNCNLFGILFEGDTYYLSVDQLIARDCRGIGIAFGYNYGDVFSTFRFNSVDIGYLRAAQCGTLYDAELAPTGFHINDNPTGGCGIFLRLKSSSKVRSMLSEGNYGPGLTVHPYFGGRTRIGSQYLERNGRDAELDGAAPSVIQMVLYNDAAASHNVYIEDTWIDDEANNNIYYYDSAGLSRFFFRNARSLHFMSNVTGTIPVDVSRDPGTVLTCDPGIVLMLTAGRSIARQVVARGDYFTFSGRRGGEATLSATTDKRGFGSGEVQPIFNVTLGTPVVWSAATSSILVSVSFSASTANNDVHVVTKTYIVTLNALRRFSGASSLFSNVNEIDVLDNYAGPSVPLISNSQITVGDVTTGPSGPSITIFASFDSGGADTYNACSASAVFLSSGLRGGQPANITPA